MARIAQKDIAAALGIAVSTVSKALSGDPKIAEATKQAVREMAKTLGFSPDPMLGALARYRKARAPETYHATLGWLCNYPEDTDMTCFPGYEDYFKGAEARGNELGYKLTPFHLSHEVGTDRMASIFLHRGIEGLIIAPQVASNVKMDWPWEKFCLTTIGFSLISPQINLVTNDHFQTLVTILERLRVDGHTRIGCYMNAQDNLRMHKRMQSALLSYGNQENLQMLIYDIPDPASFWEWQEANRLEVVIIGKVPVWEWVESRAMSNSKKPKVVGYAMDPQETRYSGMYHNNLKIGALAVDNLTNLIHHREFGIPENRLKIMVEGIWLGPSPG